MKNALLIFLVAVSGCGKKSNCIDESKKHDVACYTVYDPVCGCNNVTYGNSCEAEAAGVISYKKGKCGQ